MSTKLSYDTLFDQWQPMLDSSKPPENTPDSYENIKSYKILAGLCKPIRPKVDVEKALEVETLALWNPLFGGKYMLCATYLCSVGMGSANVDSFGQLRSALHLYNGLQMRDPTCNVPFLQRIDTVFKDTQTVWFRKSRRKDLVARFFGCRGD